jgi:hypothetical protein
MANPIYFLSRKLMQHPWLKTQGDRTMVAIVLVMMTIIVLTMVGSYRENVDISACKAQGGTPIYRTAVQEVTDSQGNSFRQEYQVFDRCSGK